MSQQLALKVWSVVARHLHEGSGIVILYKTWDPKNDAFLVFPWYGGQDPDALKPHVWMSLRHELKAPLGGHTFIRDYAEVVDTIPIQSLRALRIVDAEHALTPREAERRYREGYGLVALVLRVYHLPRAYKFYDVAEKAGEDEFVPLPFEVALEDLTPAIDDAEFERRLAQLKAAIPTAATNA